MKFTNDYGTYTSPELTSKFLIDPSDHCGDLYLTANPDRGIVDKTFTGIPIEVRQWSVTLSGRDYFVPSNDNTP